MGLNNINKEIFLLEKYLNEFVGDKVTPTNELEKKIIYFLKISEPKKWIRTVNALGEEEVVIVFVDYKNIEKIPQFYKLLDDNGYYVSSVARARIKGVEKPQVLIDLLKKTKSPIPIVLEKFYDNSWDKPEQFYWHVTPSKNVPKIKKQGLVPGYNYKLSYHPKRVYLAVSKQSAINIYEQFDMLNDITYILLQINGELGVPLYRDPNFAAGVYTTQPIPPTKIVKAEKLD